MFDILFSVNKSQVIGATYYAIRLIKHRHRIRDIYTGFIVPGLASEPSLEEQKLAIQLLEEIQNVGQVPLKSLTQSKADEYIGQLSDISLQRSIEGISQETSDRAKQILEELRKEPIISHYPAPNRQPLIFFQPEHFKVFSSQILEIVDDIAERTNLLALHAAAEAARADEPGKGIALVADEARKLAERTTKATQRIADMLKAIHDSDVPKN